MNPTEKLNNGQKNEDLQNKANLFLNIITRNNFYIHAVENKTAGQLNGGEFISVPRESLLKILKFSNARKGLTYTADGKLLNYVQSSPKNSYVTIPSSVINLYHELNEDLNSFESAKETAGQMLRNSVSQIRVRVQELTTNVNQIVSEKAGELLTSINPRDLVKSPIGKLVLGLGAAVLTTVSGGQAALGQESSVGDVTSGDQTNVQEVETSKPKGRIPRYKNPNKPAPAQEQSAQIEAQKLEPKAQAQAQPAQTEAQKVSSKNSDRNPRPTGSPNSLTSVPNIAEQKAEVARGVQPVEPQDPIQPQVGENISKDRISQSGTATQPQEVTSEVQSVQNSQTEQVGLGQSSQNFEQHFDANGGFTVSPQNLSVNLTQTQDGTTEVQSDTTAHQVGSQPASQQEEQVASQAQQNGQSGISFEGGNTPLTQGLSNEGGQSPFASQPEGNPTFRVGDKSFSLNGLNPAEVNNNLTLDLTQVHENFGRVVAPESQITQADADRLTEEANQGVARRLAESVGNTEVISLFFAVRPTIEEFKLRTLPGNVDVSEYTDSQIIGSLDGRNIVMFGSDLNGSRLFLVENGNGGYNRIDPAQITSGQLRISDTFNGVTPIDTQTAIRLVTTGASIEQISNSIRNVNPEDPRLQGTITREEIQSVQNEIGSYTNATQILTDIGFGPNGASQYMAGTFREVSSSEFGNRATALIALLSSKNTTNTERVRIIAALRIVASLDNINNSSSESQYWNKLFIALNEIARNGSLINSDGTINQSGMSPIYDESLTEIRMQQVASQSNWSSQRGIELFLADQAIQTANLLNEVFIDMSEDAPARLMQLVIASRNPETIQDRVAFASEFRRLISRYNPRNYNVRRFLSGRLGNWAAMEQVRLDNRARLFELEKLNREFATRSGLSAGESSARYDENGNINFVRLAIGALTGTINPNYSATQAGEGIFTTRGLTSANFEQIMQLAIDQGELTIDTSRVGLPELAEFLVESPVGGLIGNLILSQLPFFAIGGSESSTTTAVLSAEQININRDQRTQDITLQLINQNPNILELITNATLETSTPTSAFVGLTVTLPNGDVVNIDEETATAISNYLVQVDVAVRSLPEDYQSAIESVVPVELLSVASGVPQFGLEISPDVVVAQGASEQWRSSFNLDRRYIQQFVGLSPRDAGFKHLRLSGVNDDSALEIMQTIRQNGNSTSWQVSGGYTVERVPSYNQLGVGYVGNIPRNFVTNGEILIRVTDSSGNIVAYMFDACKGNPLIFTTPDIPAEQDVQCALGACLLEPYVSAEYGPSAVVMLMKLTEVLPPHVAARLLPVIETANNISNQSSLPYLTYAIERMANFSSEINGTGSFVTLTPTQFNEFINQLVSEEINLNATVNVQGNNSSILAHLKAVNQQPETVEIFGRSIATSNITDMRAYATSSQTIDLSIGGLFGSLLDILGGNSGSEVSRTVGEWSEWSEWITDPNNPDQQISSRNRTVSATSSSSRTIRGSLGISGQNERSVTILSRDQMRWVEAFCNKFNISTDSVVAVIQQSGFAFYVGASATSRDQDVNNERETQTRTRRIPPKKPPQAPPTGTSTPPDITVTPPVSAPPGGVGTPPTGGNPPSTNTQPDGTSVVSAPPATTPPNPILPNQSPAPNPDDVIGVSPVTSPAAGVIPEAPSTGFNPVSVGGTAVTGSDLTGVAPSVKGPGRGPIPNATPQLSTNYGGSNNLGGTNLGSPQAPNSGVLGSDLVNPDAPLVAPRI
jgi:hypothetical protein